MARIPLVAFQAFARIRRLVAVATTSAVLLLGPGGALHEAAAAVRVCKPMALGPVVEATSEYEARRAAVSGWLELAGRHGIGFQRFQIALARDVGCARSAAGFRCQAVGRPCTISQLPRPDLPQATRDLPPPTPANSFARPVRTALD